MYFQYIKVNTQNTYFEKYFSPGRVGVKMSTRAAARQGGPQGELRQTNVYSVVFTNEAEKTGFEMFLLRGEMPKPAQIEYDLRKAREWVEAGGLLHAGKGD
jgi:hypothetical protein